MNIEQLKKKLEPFIRKVVRDELRKQKSKEFDPNKPFGPSPIYSDDQMDQAIKNARKAMDLLKDFDFGKNDKKDDKKMEVEWTK